MNATSSNNTTTALAQRNVLPMESRIGGEQSTSRQSTHLAVPLAAKGYVRGERLGVGGFGEVYIGLHSKTSKKYAIKIFEKQKLSKGRMGWTFECEKKALEVLNHANIINLHDSIETSTYSYLIMDLGYKDMYSWAKENNEHGLDRRALREILLGIVKPLKYLHRMNYAHLDIKLENILVTKNVAVNEMSQEHVKLCDFGLSTNTTESPVLGVKGTAPFFAPEMALDNGYDACAADMFSVGATIMDLLNLIPSQWNAAYDCYEEDRKAFLETMRRLLFAIQQDDEFFEGIPFPVVRIIRGLVEWDPKKRLTAAQTVKKIRTIWGLGRQSQPP